MLVYSIYCLDFRPVGYFGRHLRPGAHHISVSDLYIRIPTIGLPIWLLQNIGRQILWNINRSQMYEYGNWEQGRAVWFPGTHNSNLFCGARKGGRDLSLPLILRCTVIIFFKWKRRHRCSDFSVLTFVVVFFGLRRRQVVSSKNISFLLTLYTSRL